MRTEAFLEDIDLRTVSIYCIDDNMEGRSRRLASYLVDAGFHTTYSPDRNGDSHAAVQIIACRNCDNTLFDAVRNASFKGRVIVLAEKNKPFSSSGSRELIENGAADVIFCSGGDVNNEILLRLRRWMEVDSLMQSQIVRRVVCSQAKWRRHLSAIVEVSAFTEDSILLTGESGTGKELIAKVIHDLDRRRKKTTYTILDCTTISEGLSGSEFFGHERGAFTGAHSARDGVFALADGGTLFLDEIGELPMQLQAQLLRVIQEGTYRRVGSNVWHRTHFRLICATNRDIQDEINKGRFRRDLYHRIAQWTFRLPSLEERREDVLALANHFLCENNGDSEQLKFDPVVEEYLHTRSYPGNVRELRLLVYKMKNLNTGGKLITSGCIPRAEWDYLDSTSNENESNGGRLRVDNALASAMGLEEIANLARSEAIQKVLWEEFSHVNFDSKKRAIVLKRTKDRLKCSLRWIQVHAKKNNMFESPSNGA